METDDAYESGFEAIQVESLPPSATAQPPTQYEGADQMQSQAER